MSLSPMFLNINHRVTDFLVVK